MTIARERMLARIGKKLWLTEGGLETELVFHDGLDLPCFAAFILLDSDAGRERLARYAAEYLDASAELRRGFILDTQTWRASHGWGAKLGLSASRIAEINIEAAQFLLHLRTARGQQALQIMINGVVGPAGDGYAPERQMSMAEAQAYHQPQLTTLAAARVDMATAMTLTHVEEAIGATLAARAARLPFVCSFTVETDGHLPSGMALEEAIARVDTATSGWPMWFGINCAHPDHVSDQLTGSWVARIGTRLLAEAEDGDMSIIVADRNETAHRLYLSLGYVEQARASVEDDWGCESREWVLLAKPAALAKRSGTA